VSDLPVSQPKSALGLRAHAKWFRDKAAEMDADWLRLKTDPAATTLEQFAAGDADDVQDLGEFRIPAVAIRN